MTTTTMAMETGQRQMAVVKKPYCIDTLADRRRDDCAVNV